MASNPHFLCQFSSFASFSSVYFVYLFLLFFFATTTTTTITTTMKTDKTNADYWLFLALFQGKELFFVLCGKKFFKRHLPFGLNSCITQQNKGVSKTFYHITKNRVPYLEIKWKSQKNLQFHRLVVEVVVVVVAVVVAK